LCRLTRASRDDPYGFDFKTLKTEGRHVANNVRPGLPASKAGLREGDYILEVNGEQIHVMEHDQVVHKISQHPNHVDLLVVGDLQGYLIKYPQKQQHAQHNQQQPPKYNDDENEVDLDARIPSTEITFHRIQLMPGFKGLGISLTPNGIINAIEPNSPSDLAGLKKDYRIVLVNNVDVRDKSNKEIARLIKENEANLVLGILKSGAETPLLIHKHQSQQLELAAQKGDYNHIENRFLSWYLWFPDRNE
jgi:C-terminal processing protease CtpA/Prc